MQLITPFDFADEFPEGSTLCIVGNAQSLAAYGLGKKIDSYEVVVRFNECAVEGFAEQVGRRTDILVTNPYAEARSRPMLDGGSTRVVLAINPQKRRGEKAVFERWVGANKVLFTYTPDLVGVQHSTHLQGLTTGTYAIQLLWRLIRPKRLLITGFTMFAEAEHSHYWKTGLSPGIRSHNIPEEARLFCEVLNSMSSRCEITPDVAQVFQRVGLERSPRLQLLELGASRP